MGHLLKMKCVHSRVNMNILGFNKCLSCFDPATVQVTNLALTRHETDNSVGPPRDVKRRSPMWVYSDRMRLLEQNGLNQRPPFFSSYKKWTARYPLWEKRKTPSWSRGLMITVQGYVVQGHNILPPSGHHADLQGRQLYSRMLQERIRFLGGLKPSPRYRQNKHVSSIDREGPLIYK
jgi:hypothetical protein